MLNDKNMRVNSDRPRLVIAVNSSIAIGFLQGQLEYFQDRGFDATVLSPDRRKGEWEVARPEGGAARGPCSLAEPCSLPILHAARIAVRDHQGTEAATSHLCRALSLSFCASRHMRQPECARESDCLRTHKPGASCGFRIRQLQWCGCCAFRGHAKDDEASSRVAASVRNPCGCACCDICWASDL